MLDAFRVQRNVTPMNKADEWLLLRASFLPSEIQMAMPYEAPDFLVPEGTAFLGVEITEAFMSDSNARMMKIPDYLGEVLIERRYRHSDDKRVYPIKRVRYNAQDGSPVDLEGVVYLKPTFHERIFRLESTVLAKARRIPIYQTKCSVVELVLCDRGIFSGEIDKTEIGKIFHQKRLRMTIQESGFREVRYLTLATDGATYCYPVRAGILAEEVFLFFACLAEAKCAAAVFEAGSGLSVHLTNERFRSVSVFAHPPHTLTIFCDAGVAVYNNGSDGIEIFHPCSERAALLKQDPGVICVPSSAVVESLSPMIRGASCSFDIARLAKMF